MTSRVSSDIISPESSLRDDSNGTIYSLSLIGENFLWIFKDWKNVSEKDVIFESFAARVGSIPDLIIIFQTGNVISKFKFTDRVVIFGQPGG